MKKLLGIVVLGLMVQCAGGGGLPNTNEFHEWNQYKLIETKYKVFGKNAWSTRHWSGSSNSSLDEALDDFHSGWGFCDFGGCIITFINEEEITKKRQKEIAKKYLPPDMFNKIVFDKGPSKEEKKKIKMASMIDDAKSTCKDLGFEEGTETFSDCSLKLYSQSVELAAKNNQQIVIQGQSSGSSSMTIYDPVRDNNALIKRGQGLINGTCTLADLSTC